MEPTGPAPWNNSGHWTPPSRQPHHHNAARRLPDGFGGRHNAATPPGTRRPDVPAGRHRLPGQRAAEAGKPEPAAIRAAVEEWREEAGARTPHGYWPQFQQAVAELSAGGVDVAGMVRLLHAAGWRQVGPDEVTGALRRIKAANAARHFLPGRSLPAPRPAPPGRCPSCEVPVTEWGLCRCS